MTNMANMHTIRETPWGKPDNVVELAPGIIRVGTPSHGGFYLSDDRKAEVDPRYREFADEWAKGWGDNWYEEDCAALAVVVTWPEVFDVDRDSNDYYRYKELLEKWTE